jgi:hypothetical protein
MLEMLNKTGFQLHNVLIPNKTSSLSMSESLEMASPSPFINKLMNETVSRPLVPVVNFSILDFPALQKYAIQTLISVIPPHHFLSFIPKIGAR